MPRYSLCEAILHTLQERHAMARSPLLMSNLMSGAAAETTFRMTGRFRPGRWGLTARCEALWAGEVENALSGRQHIPCVAPQEIDKGKLHGRRFPVCARGDAIRLAAHGRG